LVVNKLRKRHTRTIAGCAALATAGVFAPTGSQSQTPAALPVSVSSAQSFRVVTDVFVGRNTVGPYVLSWRGFDTGSEQVTRSGQLLQANIDYKLDPATGVLTFTAPLKSQLPVCDEVSDGETEAIANSA